MVLCKYLRSQHKTVALLVLSNWLYLLSDLIYPAGAIIIHPAKEAARCALCSYQALPKMCYKGEAREAGLALYTRPALHEKGSSGCPYRW